MSSHWRKLLIRTFSLFLLKLKADKNRYRMERDLELGNFLCCQLIFAFSISFFTWTLLFYFILSLTDSQKCSIIFYFSIEAVAAKRKPIFSTNANSTRFTTEFFLSFPIKFIISYVFASSGILVGKLNFFNIFSTRLTRFLSLTYFIFSPIFSSSSIPIATHSPCFKACPASHISTAWPIVWPKLSHFL